MQCSGVIGEAETTAVKRSAGRCVCTYTALHVLLHELHDVGAPHTRLLTHEPHYAGAPHACLLMHCFNHTMLELHPRCVCVCLCVCVCAFVCIYVALARTVYTPYMTVYLQRGLIEARNGQVFMCSLTYTPQNWQAPNLT